MSPAATTCWWPNNESCRLYDGMATLIDFTSRFDHLMLSRSEFTAYGGNRVLNSLDFIAGTAASHVINGGLIYDRAQGNLYYDVDGHSALTQIAHLNPNTNLTITDFSWFKLCGAMVAPWDAALARSRSLSPDIPGGVNRHV